MLGCYSGATIVALEAMSSVTATDCPDASKAKKGSAIGSQIPKRNPDTYPDLSTLRVRPHSSRSHAAGLEQVSVQELRQVVLERTMEGALVPHFLFEVGSNRRMIGVGHRIPPSCGHSEHRQLWNQRVLHYIERYSYPCRHVDTVLQQRRGLVPIRRLRGITSSEFVGSLRRFWRESPPHKEGVH
jgi:hypothetical protein